MGNVDWKKLKHAQGPATRVPLQIQELSKAGHPSDAAAFQLTEALVVEGKWLATSAPAAELLVEQLTKKGAKPTPAALRLLGDLAAGDHLWFIGPEAPAKRAKDKAGQATLGLARAAIPLAVKWLLDEEPERRAAAVFFLALVDDAASGAKIAELARDDAAPEIRGGAALALGFYSREGHASAEAALAKLEGDGFVTAGRWAAGVIAGEPITDDATAAAIRGWFASWAPALLPWGRSQPLRLVEALMRIVPDGEKLAPILARAASAGDRFLCKLAIELAGFDRSFHQYDVAKAASLSPLQRATAEALIGVPQPLFWMDAGLPGSRVTAERWLGLAPSGPLERVEKDGRMRWERVRALYDAKKTPSAEAIIGASLEGLGPAEQLEVATELLLGAYKILIQIDAKITPTALGELAHAAGNDAVPWARGVATFAANAYARSENTNQLSASHLLVVLGVLVDAGVSLDPSWDRLVWLDGSPEARKVIAAMPAPRRSAIVVGQLAGYATKTPVLAARELDKVAGLLDVAGTPEVVSAMRALLASSAVAKFAKPETVAKLAAAPAS